MVSQVTLGHFFLKPQLGFIANICLDNNCDELYFLTETIVIFSVFPYLTLQKQTSAVRSRDAAKIDD